MEMTEDAKAEALRLVDQTQLDTPIDTPLTADQIEGIYHFTLDELVRFVELARAPQAGWVQLLHETRALLAEWGEWYYCRKDDAPSHKMERVLAAIDAAIAAAPNAQEE
jgi:hypothetical protein